jgi:hypothetical protein
VQFLACLLAVCKLFAMWLLMRFILISFQLPLASRFECKSGKMWKLLAVKAPRAAKHLVSRFMWNIRVYVPWPEVNELRKSSRVGCRFTSGSFRLVDTMNFVDHPRSFAFTLESQAKESPRKKKSEQSVAAKIIKLKSFASRALWSCTKRDVGRIRSLMTLGEKFFDQKPFFCVSSSWCEKTSECN